MSSRSLKESKVQVHRAKARTASLPDVTFRRFFHVAAAILLLSVPYVSRGADDPYAQHIAQTPPLSPQEQQKKFHLPPGFEIHLVAAEPDVRKPINMNFDHRGRLWVTGSEEYPFHQPDESKARDTVKILEDTTGDGRADRITTFAENLSIPMGVLPMLDGAIVWSIPYVYRFYDDNGDGRADRREKLLGPFGHDDTHGNINGFTWGFDGWVYSCHGFSNTSEIAGADGHKIRMHSGHTFRFRPDGSRVEHVTFGQVNPFGLAFDPLGHMFTADCHSRPIYQLLRGAYYPSFGKPHDGLGFGPEACDHDHGSTALCGITFYAADHFPPEYHGTVFTGDVVSIVVDQDHMERRGSSYRAVHRPPFIRCDDPWFRPVDIQLAPDGSVYIADFYNRLIGHYEVPLTHPGRDRERGRIWRIVYTGPDGNNRARQPRADWSKASIQELIQDLGHANLWVRKHATQQLVDRIGRDAIEPVRAMMALPPSAGNRRHIFQRMHGVWTLERTGGLDERTLRATVGDPAEGVRVHAQRVLSERAATGNWTSLERELAFAGLRDDDGAVRQAAAEALGRYPSPEHLRPLLEARLDVPEDDPQLLHTVRIAIRNQLNLPESWAVVREEIPAPAGPGGKFDDVIADVALGVHEVNGDARSPAATSAGFLLGYGRQHKPSPEVLKLQVEHIARYLVEDELAAALDLADQPVDAAGQAVLLRAFNDGLQRRGTRELKPLTRRGRKVAAQLFEHDQVLPAVELVQALKLPGFHEKLAAVASSMERPLPERRLACQVLSEIHSDGGPDNVALAVLSRIVGNADEPLDLRSHAATALGRIQTESAVEALIAQLRTAPASVATPIAAGLAQRGKRHQAVERLLDEVAGGRAPARLLTDRSISTALDRLDDSELKERIAALIENAPTPEEEALQLIKQHRAGFLAAHRDPLRGAQVYETTCSACHRLGGVGEDVGPNLDGVGHRGLDRLLEDLLDPNLNLDPAFRTTLVELEDGTIQSGLLRGEEGETLVLINTSGETIRIPQEEIYDQWMSRLSPMPSNIASDLPGQDLYDLLEFLLAQKQPAAEQLGDARTAEDEADAQGGGAQRAQETDGRGGGGQQAPVVTRDAPDPVTDNSQSSAPDEAESGPREQVLDVAGVWAGHPVGFALLTHAPWQFVAFYDDERHMTVGARRLDQEPGASGPDPAWHFVRLPERMGWDSHNYVTMTIDDEGLIHLSGNMHNVPLVYFRTAKPLDIDTFERIEQMVGRQEKRCTYPRFLRSPAGELLFTYRDGGSGNGEQIYNVYETSTRTWRRLLDEPLMSGQGRMNAYPHGPVRGPDGWQHMCWVWRDTPDCATNHHLSYARSRDLVNWETSRGEPLKLPITIENADIVDPVPPGGGMINGNTHIGFDSRGRVIISYHKFDEAGATQVYNARLEDGQWKIYQTSDWTYRWEFRGGGSIIFEVRVRPVQSRSGGRLTQGYYNRVHGSGTWILDEETLRPVPPSAEAQDASSEPPTPAAGAAAPSAVPAAGQDERDTSPRLENRRAGDSGRSPDPNVRYELRWQTWPANRDRPRDTPPPPTMLRLHRLRTR